MNSLDSYKHVVVLFDEQGTPTFRTDRETDVFLGMAALYDLSDEDSIFKTSDALFGLSNSKPLRNTNISVERVNKITELLTNLPVQLVISIVNLSDSEFQQNVELHEELGNQLRPRHRNVRVRPLAHIMHTAILDECIFQSICNYSERTQQNSIFSIHIDDWSIPAADIEIYLKERTQSFESKINGLFQDHNFQFQIRVPPISLLNEDNERKRFIGVLASVISRSFMHREDERYSEKPISLIVNGNTHTYVDITKKAIGIFRKVWDKSLRNPPRF